MLLAQSLDARARYHDLDRAAPGLAARLASIDQSLEKLPSADDPIKADDATLAGWRDDLTRQRDTLLQQIRDLPGFADFLQPPAFATLRDAAALGPVVIINVSAYRCDALTVTTSGVRATRLPDLTGAAAVRHVSAFLDALDYRPPGSAGKTIARTLAWLWDAVVSPLLPDLLTACGTPTRGQRPFVWWCPTGPLTFLPLHAAGRHDRSGEAVLDRFISSYAPTLLLLRQMRQRVTLSASKGRPLIVALPATPGQKNIPDADQEADAFVKRFTGAMHSAGRRPPPKPSNEPCSTARHWHTSPVTVSKTSAPPPQGASSSMTGHSASVKSAGSALTGSTSHSSQHVRRSAVALSSQTKQSLSPRPSS